MDNPVCPKCGEQMVKRGHSFSRNARYQRYQCKTCNFTTSAPISEELHERIPVIIDKVLKGER